MMFKIVNISCSKIKKLGPKGVADLLRAAGMEVNNNLVSTCPGGDLTIEDTIGSFGRSYKKYIWRKYPLPLDQAPAAMSASTYSFPIMSASYYTNSAGFNSQGGYLPPATSYTALMEELNTLRKEAKKREEEEALAKKKEPKPNSTDATRDLTVDDIL